MARHASSRGRVAMAATLALTAGPLALAVPSAVAAPAVAATGPTDTVIDAGARIAPRDETLYGAGRTGYLHREETDNGASEVVWTDYATGRSRSAAYSGGGVNGSLTARYDLQAETVHLTDLDSGESVRIAAPSGQTVWRAGGFTDRTAVSFAYDRAGGTVSSLHLLRAEADGTVSDRTVTGLPDGVTGVNRIRVQDRDGAVLVVNGPEGDRAFLLDYRTGRLQPLFPGLTGHDQPTKYALSADRVLGYRPDGAVAHTVERDAPDATPKRTTIPGPVDSTGTRRATMALAGDHILVVHEETLPKRYVGQPLYAVRIGGSSTTLLDHARTTLAPAADGSVLVVGGTGATDWAVRRVLANGAGEARTTVVREVEPVRAPINGLALGGGRLTVALPGGGGVRTLRGFDLSVTGAPKVVAGPEHVFTLFDGMYTPCAEGSGCVRLHPLGNGRVAYAAGKTVHEPTSPNSYRMIAPGAGRVDLADASGRYTLINERGTNRYYVGDSENAGREPIAHTFTARSAAVWGTKVWRPGKTTGTVVSYDLKSRKTSAAVSLGSRCAPNDLQVAGRWLYWACAGKAGVRDLTAKKNITVPKGGAALLGDGYLVRRNGTRLELTDFRKGVAPRSLATVPKNARPGVDWTVDKFGGHVAYVDADQRVRIVPVAVDRSPVTSIESRTDREVSAAGKGGTWQGHWQLSRPATAWKVTFKDASGRTSGSVRGTAHDAASVTARWHARTPDGAKPRSGRHTWTLTVKGAGDSAYRTVKTGTLDLTGGR
ncbi:hypothetical protein [Streptomyces sp. NPDC059063]|uniref:hypothetical protein n=1 Tax=unclassified Streptomyces TaxID=2593676 RepID=UPI0036736D4C